jgi:superfamily II RNA helicase
MLRIVDLKEPPPDVPNPYPYPLDTFQKFAFDAINKGENVLVTAKTGSGKTLVGEYQIKVSVEKGKRVFYTTPIKSLSNQKFHDLKELGYSVGIMTGDIKFCPDAAVVVMTTEILCNLLFQKSQDLSLDDVDAIVFDEVHYINNPERGKVWEQALMMLDPSINLVLLSATIAEPHKLAGWLGHLKQVPMHLISTQYRVVPLIHKVGDEILMDARDQFHPDAYNRWLFSLEKVKKGVVAHKETVKDRRAGGYDGGTISRTDRIQSFEYRLNQQVIDLDKKGLLPALVFVFSRKKCEEYADKIESQLIDSSDAAAVRHIVKFHLRHFPDLETSPQYHQIFALLEKGIAFHHSGLMPVLKEIIEILFGRGLVKLLFATETFAVGINMPTKTVIFTAFQKHDGNLRMLRTDEYIQMAGRAGRRGKDTQGLVLYLPDRDPVPLDALRQMMTGGQQRVCSRMDFGYDFLIRTFYGTHDWKELLKKSYWFQQNQEYIVSLHHDRNNILVTRDRLSISDDMADTLAERQALELTISSSVNAARRNAQKSLDQWKLNHPMLSNKPYAEYCVLTDRLKRTDLQIADSENYEAFIEPKLSFLTRHGYMTTRLGKLASLIHEAHPLLMSYAFQEKLFHYISIPMLMGCLAIFIEDEEPISLDDSRYMVKSGSDGIRSLVEYSSMLASDETEPTEWNIGFYWIDVAIRWLSGDNAYQICTDYGIYEGNFIRGMLKLANIADEWIAMATESEDIAMLDLLRDVRSLIVRGIVVPDSLYLRM